MRRKLFVTICLALCSIGIYAQSTVTGTVTGGDSGEPLEGVAIVVKGTTIGAFTNAEGKFSIELPADAVALTASLIGYRVQEIPLNGQTNFNISMTAGELALDEIVITGYGTQIKRELTGNIVKVSGEEIENLPVPSIEQALQGRTAGVFVEAVNGKPGGQIRMRVRGASSISASNQPLFVIDGIPVTTDAQNTSGAAINPLADLNFNDVESIEILKDASAAAIFGSRAANGVVIITTKQGQQGKTKFNVNLQAGVSNPTGEREFLNAEEYVELFTRTATGAGKYDFRTDPGAWTNEQEAIDFYLGFVEGRFDRYSGNSDWRTLQTDTDWQELAFRDNAAQRAVDVSASGGSGKTTFYASAAYNQQEGILVGNGFERMSGRLNLNHDVNESLTFGLQMGLSRTSYDQVANDNAFSTPLQLIAQSPLTPVRDENGILNDRPITTYYNGLIEIEEAKRDIVGFRNLSNAYAQLELAPGLSVRGEFGIDLYNLKENTFWGSRTFAGQATNGQATSRFSQVVNINTKAYLNFKKTLAEIHNIDLIGGVGISKIQNRQDFCNWTGISSR